MKIVNRLVNSLILISLAVFLALLSLAVLKVNSLLLTFPYLTFTLTVVVCLFVVSLLLKAIHTHFYRTLAFIFLAIIPIGIHGMYFFDSFFLEENSSFFIASLLATISIGLLSNLQIFETKNKYILIGVLLLTILMILLTVLPFGQAYLFSSMTYVLIIFSAVAIFASLLSKR